MKKYGCHSAAKVLPFNIFIILFYNKNKMVVLEGCSSSDVSVAFLVMLFLNTVIYTSTCFLSGFAYLMCHHFLCCFI